ncbi:MbtH family protein [Streptomyces polyrhachis]|uniref:MbtH family protein n=1 Tax=Streptomyces polyrhachis TaxID=1282885 RepID=A0ABW2GPA2_9ACTN
MAENETKVLVNDEEQYSLWPAYLAVPSGWRDTGVAGTKEGCLEYVREVWTDMRPLSLRRHMEAGER